jgi:hypothetical protein
MPAPSRHPSSTQGRFWRNPFLIALITLGVGLMAFGVDRYAWATSRLFPHASMEPPAGGSTIAARVLWVISPLLVISGVLAIVAVLVLAVIAWLPRRQG